MSKMKAENFIGSHKTGKGTVQELIDVLMKLPPRVRQCTLVAIDLGEELYEIYEVEIANPYQDQPEEIKVYIKAN